MRSVKFLTAAASLALAGAQLVADVPYPEVIPGRSAFSGSWTPAELPSAWSTFPCTNVSANFIAVQNAGTPQQLAAPMFACASGALYDALNSKTLTASIPITPDVVFGGASESLFSNSASAVACDGTSLYAVSCASVAATCAFSAIATHGLGAVSSVVATLPQGAGGPTTVWVTGAGGTAAFSGTSASSPAAEVYRDAAAYTAVAFSAARREVALGNASKLVLLDASQDGAPQAQVAAGGRDPLLPPRIPTRWDGASPSAAGAAALYPLKRWLWVTNISSGAGGELDDVITALAYDDAPMPADGSGSGNGTLYVGSATCLNILFPNGTTVRIDGMGGLPWGNISSVAVGAGVDAAGTPSASRFVWLGTSMGLVLFDPFALPDVAGSPFGPLGGVRVAAGGSMRSSVARAPQPRPAVGAVRGSSSSSSSSSSRVAIAAVAPASSSAAAPAAASTAGYQPRWRYMYGPRFLPSTPADHSASLVRAGGIVLLPAAAAAQAGLHVPVGATGPAVGAASPADVAWVATDGGVTVLQTQLWTLAAKAALMETYLAPHIVDGQINDCGYPSFGVSAKCTWGPGANDGLWSSLVVAAEAWRFAVTGDAAALETGTTVFYGMKLLNDVTGITGLIARAAIDPSFPFPGGQDWHRSTSLPGYSWLGDASSDEVDGHAMAYPIVADLLAAGNATLRAAAVATLTNLARYIVKGNFTMVDVTGKPTSWGRWDPGTLNGERDMSDGRGTNSLEILALIAGALKYAAPGSDDAALFTEALSYLALDNGYNANMLNLRINAPCDINYSDDELEFFSYLALLSAANASDPLQASIRAAAVASIRRSWYTGVAATRSNLWGVIYLAATGAVAPIVGSSSSPSSFSSAADSTPQQWGDAQAIAEDVAWNLRTWAVELTGWPVRNSHRLDLVRDPAQDRFGNANDATVVLPMRERSQDRWNADPFSMDGGDGGGQADPGVWLMPYWGARYYGVVGA